MKDMTSEILRGVIGHADGQIAKHKATFLFNARIQLVLQNMETM